MRACVTVRTGILVAKLLGSKAWLGEYLLGLASSVTRKLFAKWISLILFATVYLSKGEGSLELVACYTDMMSQVASRNSQFAMADARKQQLGGLG